ncbi:MAG: hypothetical protein JSR46_01070 [Verrucomicrobia bacterium]|nr:hypothetical protein [Verrucomicrobiota bacterium]
MAGISLLGNCPVQTSYYCLTGGKKKNVKQTKNNQVEEQRVGDCQRKCTIAKVAADALCAGLATRGGAKAVALCVTAVEILSQECDDCCAEGFNECAKKIGAFLADGVDAMFPPGVSILD